MHALQVEPSPVVQQLGPATVPLRPEAGHNHRLPDDRPHLTTAPADEGDGVGIDGNRIVYQLKMTLRAVYPTIRRRMQVCKNATRAQLEKERDRVNARIAAALESYMDGDD